MTCGYCQKDLRSVMVTIEFSTIKIARESKPVCGNAKCLLEALKDAHS